MPSIEVEATIGCASCGYPDHAGHAPSCEGQRQKLNEKMAAIARQSPRLSEDVVRRTAQAEVDQGTSVEGAVDFGLRWYELKGESRETMETWKAEVNDLLIALREGIASGDFSSFAEKSRGTFHERDLRTIVGKLEAQAREAGVEIDAEAQTLLAIGLWLWREQGGEWKTGMTELKLAGRVLSGETQIADALSPENDPSCLETSHLVRAVAREFGIGGDVKTTPRALVDHRYFETDSGKILDYWWMRGTGGVALSERAFTEARPDVKTIK